jgi:hypothetical protein
MMIGDAEPAQPLLEPEAFPCLEVDPGHAFQWSVAEGGALGLRKLRKDRLVRAKGRGCQCAEHTLSVVRSGTGLSRHRDLHLDLVADPSNPADRGAVAQAVSQREYIAGTTEPLEDTLRRVVREELDRSA